MDIDLIKPTHVMVALQLTWLNLRGQVYCPETYLVFQFKQHLIHCENTFLSVPLFNRFYFSIHFVCVHV